jgi:hypothetical protein
MNDFDEAVEMVIRANEESKQRGALSTWTIYDKPKDWPDGYIARRFEVTKQGGTPTTSVLKGDDTDAALETMRLVLETAGMVCLVRNGADHSTVVETWI